MANTNILIKRSNSVGRPVSLLAGELAYSYASNTIFIGSPTGNGVVNVGGQYYTSQVDNATDAATGSTLVRRDATGNASFNFITANIIGTIQGTANSALQLENSRNFSISGGDITAAAVGFNGTADVTLNTSLNSVPGLNAGTYGSTTAIPIIQVAANGRVMNVTTAAISTSFTVAGDTGTPQTVSGGDTLTLVGGAGITSTASATDTVTFDVDNTVVRANTPITLQTIDGSLTVNGNLTVLGTQTTINTQTLNVADPMIYLAANNTVGDAVDIGFAGTYEDGTKRHTGVFRNAGNKEYYVFDNYDKDLNSNNEIDVADSSFRTANVNARYVKANLIATTAVSDGFYGDAGAVLNLYPNESYATSGDQYIVVDPTAVNHIHIRAGGAIDSSNAELFLGGENTTVQVSDTGKEVYIRANSSHVWTFGDDGVLNIPGTITSNSTGTVTIDDNLTVTGNLVVTGDIVIDDLQVDTITANTLTLTNALTVPNGGTGKTTFTSGQIIIGSGVNGLTQIANSSVAVGQTFGSASSVAAFETDVYGRVVAVSNTSIAIDAAAITSGTLPIARGGTNGTSFTDNQITYFDGTKIASLANTTYTQTGTLTSNNTITSITVDGFGRFTAATVGAISGLTVGQGGTGLSTITQNGITYGNGTGNLGVTAAAGTADQTWSNQILTVTNAGVPVWTTALDGGQF
jgi:hypothetical protein